MYVEKEFISLILHKHRQQELEREAEQERLAILSRQNLRRTRDQKQPPASDKPQR